MIDGHSFKAALETLRQHTGVVIPVYIPQAVDGNLARSLLDDTVLGYVQQMDNPASLCLSVDGEHYGKEVAAELAKKYGVQVYCAAKNKGKLQGVRNGMARLLESRDFEYLVAVDSDGDHFANELVNLVRAARHVRNPAGIEDVMVLGQRSSRHRPMGFLRGELEELADRVLLDALAYDAAVRGRPLRLEGVTTLGEFPDFHSGYKLFSQATARAVFLQEPQLCGAAEDAYFKHGCEAVMTVEALQSGAYLVLVNRSTFNEQPVSTFGLLDRERMVADKIIWPCKRLEIPAHFVDQWLRNHMPRLLLNTLAPQGQEELQKIRRLILDEFGGETAAEDEAKRPLFV
jgi:hypothetical protein